MVQLSRSDSKHTGESGEIPALIHHFRQVQLTREQAIRYHPAYDEVQEFIQQYENRNEAETPGDTDKSTESDPAAEEKSNEKYFRQLKRHRHSFSKIFFLILLLFVLTTALLILIIESTRPSQKEHYSETANAFEGRLPQNDQPNLVEKPDATPEQKGATQPVGISPSQTTGETGEKTTVPPANSNIEKTPDGPPHTAVLPANEIVPEEQTPAEDNSLILYKYANQALQFGDWTRASHFFALSAQSGQNTELIRRCILNIHYLNSGAFLLSRLQFRQAVFGVSLSNKGDLFVTWQADSTARLWHTGGERPASHPLKHSGDIWGAKFNPDDRLLLTWGSSGILQLWYTANGSPALKPMHHDENINGAGFSTDRRFILSWSLDKTARLWFAANSSPAGDIMRHPASVNQAFFSPRTKYIFSLDSDGNGYLWEISRQNALLKKFYWKNQPVLGATFSSDEKYLAVWTHRQVIVWSIENGSPAGKPVEIAYGMVKGAAFDNQNRQILIWDDYHFARVWDIIRGKELFSLTHDDGVAEATFYAGEKIFTRSKDGQTRFWDARTGKQLTGLQSLSMPVMNGKFLHNNKFFLSAGSKGVIRVWNAGTNLPVTPPMFHPGLPDDIEFNRREDVILTFNRDYNQVNIWKIFPESFENMADSPDSGDLDFPAEYLPLMTEVLTGTFLNNQGQAVLLNATQWRQKQNEYMQVAEAHGQSCQFKEFNFFEKQKEFWKNEQTWSLNRGMFRKRNKLEP